MHIFTWTHSRIIQQSTSIEDTWHELKYPLAKQGEHPCECEVMLCVVVPDLQRIMESIKHQAFLHGEVRRQQGLMDSVGVWDQSR